MAGQARRLVAAERYRPTRHVYLPRSLAKYSVTEAMDIMNASLLNAGYTLLRQGRMLCVIDFKPIKRKAVNC